MTQNEQFSKVRYLPLAVTCLLALIGVIRVNFFPEVYLIDEGFEIEEVLPLKQKIGAYLLLGIALLAVQLKNNAWVFIFMVFLIVAAFQGVNITQTIILYRAGGFDIDVLAILLLVFHILINEKALRKFRLNWFDSFKPEAEMDLPQPKGPDPELVKRFEQKFTHKSESDLKAIIEGKHFTEEAKIAAANLLVK